MTNAVNQLPESDQAGLPGIRELLTQLQSVIEGNDELPPEEKAEALEQVKVLAEAGNNPQVPSKRSHAQTSLGILRRRLASSLSAYQLNSIVNSAVASNRRDIRFAMRLPKLLDSSLGDRLSQLATDRCQ